MVTCLAACRDSRSKGLSKFVSIDEESNHEVVYLLAADNCLAPKNGQNAPLTSLGQGDLP
jgi:hypothetical protein